MGLIRLRRGTAAAWTTANPVMAQGEPGLETDTGRLKVGDGVSTWAALTQIYLTAGAQDSITTGVATTADDNLNFHIAAGHTFHPRIALYNDTTAVWPARPITSSAVFWIGGTALPGGMLPGDIWLEPTATISPSFLASYSFDGASHANGDAVLTGQNDNGTGYDLVNVPVGGTFTYDTTHPYTGTKSGKLITPASTAGGTYGIWRAGIGTRGAVVIGASFYATAAPTTDMIILRVRRFNGTAYVQTGSLMFKASTGKFTLRDTLFADTHPPSVMGFPVATQFWAELSVDAVNGYLMGRVSVVGGAVETLGNLTTPIASLSPTRSLGGTSMDEYALGNLSPVSSYTLWMDLNRAGSDPATWVRDY